MVKVVVWLAFLNSPPESKLGAMATFSKFNQKPMQPILFFLYKKNQITASLVEKKKIFSVTPRKIVHKIHLSTSFDIPLNQKLISMYVVPYNRKNISTNIMQKKVNER